MRASTHARAQTDRSTTRAPTTDAAPVKTNMPWIEAEPILQTLRADLLPAELRSKTPASLESIWPAWVSKRDAEIRGRLARGDEDSIVNFLFFGVTFTTLPRITENDVFTGLGTNAKEIVRGRIADLASGIASPGSNERLQFARTVVERQGIDVATAAGREPLRSYLGDAVDRVVADAQRYIRENRAKLGTQPADPGVEVGPGYTLYRNRGLSSDTTIVADFGVDQTLELLKSDGALRPGSIKRVAIVGPGLDFTDKRDGYDFYPQQTIQPFAVVDSLLRLGLANAGDLRVTTFDLSDRINRHLEAARGRARTGGGYLLHLPRDPYRWNPSLVTYWERFGNRIGEETKAAAVPPAAPGVQVRAVRVRPPVVLSIVPKDLNIVLQRLEPLGAEERYDLMIATNLFLYYDVFEQSLAVVNVAKMLRPGAWLLSNNPFFELPTTPIVSRGHTDVIYSDRSAGQDRFYFYQRQGFAQQRFPSLLWASAGAIAGREPSRRPPI